MNAGHDWHPIGLSSSIDAASSSGARLFGQELVIWRDAHGAAHVWEDRCPHRGMKLSFGFVRGDHIACLYHGWQYDRAGHCQYIPAHPDLDVPKSIKVPVYPTHEQCGMIWTTLSETPTALPQAQAETVPLRSLYVECNVDTAVAALNTVGLVQLVQESSADTAVDRLSATLYAVSSGHDRLLIGVQAISDTRTALHLAICGSAAVYEGSGQQHFMRWALRLRYAIEHSGQRTTPMPGIGAMETV